MATIEQAAMYEAPGHLGSPAAVKDRYDNFIGGAWVWHRSAVVLDVADGAAEGFSLEGLVGLHFPTASARAAR